MPAAAEKFPIVGIGASAGGIQALEGFFSGLQDTTGMAFAIVTHLSPDRTSLLHEVIARYTPLPVRIAEDGAVVERGHVYVMPENAVLTIADGRLRVEHPNGPNRERKPIDVFFSALAKDQGDYAVGIVLSGGDGDGTLGIKAIKERGGLTLAQIPDGAGPLYPDMPRSAISTGLVDLAVPADDMGEKLAQFAKGLQILDGKNGLGRGEATGDPSDIEAIYAILRSQAGHDFSGYKPKTFVRRVQRRMQILHMATTADYVERLRQEQEEVTHLFRDLLINVTSFFRDEDAFESLETVVIPKLFEGKGAGDTVRVWVPGCATGEEVFSLAILMREQFEAGIGNPRVQIFATDIDEPTLAVARSARYPEALLESVSKERRDRFFVRDGASYTLTKDVREMCIFSPHSVIRDPPFSRMDLVSCRNLLIYLGPQIQGQVIPTFHYSLKPGGYLFLGTSENIGQYGHLFAAVDKKQRIFQRRDHAGFPVRHTGLIDGWRHSDRLPTPHGPRAERGALAMRQMVEAMVLDRFAPAYVIVNAEGEAVYYSARTGKYLEAPQGLPNRQLVAMARKGLRLELRSAMREASDNRRTTIRENLSVDDGDQRVQFVTITVEPLPEQGNGEVLFIVIFEDIGPSVERERAARLDRDPDATVADLERDLRDTREILQSTIEEYETALEELKSSNEELVSVNEEAQSANEELEASKEEMQSLNEELTTINTELLEKVAELDHTHGDLKNLFESTQIATVFLDRNLVIRTFTPSAADFFNLIPTDAGRPLTDLAGHLAYPELKDHIRKVVETNEIVEHRITRDDNRHYLARLLPYRDTDGRSQGVVATFIDVTRLTEAEQERSVLVAEMNHRVKNMLAVVIAIAELTAAGAPTKETYRDALVGRLRSMARAYELLAREKWKEASVLALMSQELRPFGLDHVSLDGPATLLKPRAGLALGLILHELATNAAKYGALSVPEGHIDVSWAVDGAGQTFSLKWRERGGPTVSQPNRHGFGFRLVEKEVSHTLGGTVSFDFDPEGLAIDLTFPTGAKALQAEGDDR